MMLLMNPLIAASHRCPYPYYRELLDGPKLVFDKGLNVWIASRHAVIREIFDNRHCAVRPRAEQVPVAIGGSSAGSVFGKLIRMNEGAAHAGPRRVIADALAALDPAAIPVTTRRIAHGLATRHDMGEGPSLSRWVFDLPTWVVGTMLGADEDNLPLVARWTADFVHSLSPLSSTEQLADASTAAQALQHYFAQRIRNRSSPAGLLDDVCRRAAQACWDDEQAIASNLIGLLAQTNEATAGLIGNSIVALLSQPQLQERVRAEPTLGPALVAEVARFDPPVQNTRRFVTEATSIAGVELRAGDVIVLLLAAAGRDGQVHAQPDRFLLERPRLPLAGFGHGRHACPGQQLATQIATTAIEYLLALPCALDPNMLAWTYRPSANGRLPQFESFPTKEFL